MKDEKTTERKRGKNIIGCLIRLRLSNFGYTISRVEGFGGTSLPVAELAMLQPCEMWHAFRIAPKFDESVKLRGSHPGRQANDR